MLTYKEYKQLNESLYGAINLGIRSANTVAGPIGATGASEEVVNTEPSLEEAKKCGSMMKKKMDCDSDEKEVEDEEKEVEDKDSEEEHEDEGDEEKEESEEDEKMMMKKKMKKKSKKEWNEILSDFDSLLEGQDEAVISQVKNSLEGIKKMLETKEMTEEEKTWWASVNNQLGTPGDLGFAPVGKIGQAIR